MKAILWGMEFSPEQGRRITEQLQTAYALLKNKKLLGAYRSEQEIDDDLLQVDFTYQKIIETEQRRALPDNNDFVSKIDKFFKQSEEKRIEQERKASARGSDRRIMTI